MITPIKLPLTYKKLTDWCNKEFKRLEINDWKVTKIERTRFRPDDYHAGACTMYIKCERIDKSKNPILDTLTLFVFCWLREMSDAIKNGKGIRVDFNRTNHNMKLFTDLTIKIT